MRLSEIWIYPIKSLGGIRLSTASVESRGLKYDRRWMIVGEDGTFLTQRAIPQMALLDVALLDEGLQISIRYDLNKSIMIPYKPLTANTVRVTVWDDTVEALTVSDAADLWLSEQLDKNVQLVMMPESTIRRADPRYALNNEPVSFADGFPFLLISQASLDDLNGKLSKAMEMRRFRPNFVVFGTDAFAEDTWKSIRIGTETFDIVKPCSRCILTTIDPETGEKGTEPLKTLASYRKVNNKILFGQNLVAVSNGFVREGDNISILL